MTRVAAVDCGTNSLRLLLADVDPGRAQLTDVTRRMEIVRLGQGVDKTGRLAPEALARTIAVLRDYADVIATSGVQAVRMVATSATRDADNAAEFVRLVKEVLGVAPEVLTGDEEAMLSFTGATAELAAGPDEGPYLVADIGGGSTEFVIGAAAGVSGSAGWAGTPEPRARAVSVNVGCVRMTERHLHGDPPDGREIAAATADIDAALDMVAAALPVRQARTLVGLAGLGHYGGGHRDGTVCLRRCPDPPHAGVRGGRSRRDQRLAGADPDRSCRHRSDASGTG